MAIEFDPVKGMKNGDVKPFSEHAWLKPGYVEACRERARNNPLLDFNPKLHGSNKTLRKKNTD